MEELKGSKEIQGAKQTKREREKNEVANNGAYATEIGGLGRHLFPKQHVGSRT